MGERVAGGGTEGLTYGRQNGRVLHSAYGMLQMIIDYS